MTDLTPREIVSELDRYIIGQRDAKRAVAVALRSRWRRKQLDASLRDEVYPKNILMIGPTGVGKTEISRRLAKLAKAPFIKIEATKFTEVGYVGRDVESIIRDLADAALKMLREQEVHKMRHRAEDAAEDGADDDDGVTLDGAIDGAIGQALQLRALHQRLELDQERRGLLRQRVRRRAEGRRVPGRGVGPVRRQRRRSLSFKFELAGLAPVDGVRAIGQS